MVDDALDILRTATREVVELEGRFFMFRNKRGLEDARLVQATAYVVLKGCGYQDQADELLRTMVEDEPRGWGITPAGMIPGLTTREMLRGRR